MLIAKLICGLLESHLKFKTHVSVYLFAVSAIESCCELCKFLLRHKLKHCLTAAESICVCNKINAAKQDFLKV